MSKWSLLPNAAHIDQVIASVKLYPDQCAIAQIVVSKEAWDTSVRELWDAAIRVSEWRALWDVAQDAEWLAIRGTLLCLTTYDDCAYMLDSDVGELKILAAFGDQKAILLLPACIALHSIKNIS